MESRQWGAGMWGVGLNIQGVGSHQIVFADLWLYEMSLGREREKKPEPARTQGYASTWRLGQWLEQ